MVKLPVYLDYNATTPVDPRVLREMLPYFSEHYGNAASRAHAFGWAAQEAVDKSREQVAALIGAEPKEIIFTSGATESVNLAIKGVFEAYASKGNHIIICDTEHRVVLDTCDHFEKMGADVTRLSVNASGLIDIVELEAAIKSTTILVAIMFANNETGVIQPVREISAVSRKHGVIFFSDATQAVGKIPVDVNEDGIDLLAFSSHKLYGPKGVGALFVRRKSPRVRIIAQIDGGGHERGLRSGTLNVPGIVGFGEACELCLQDMQADAAQIVLMRDRLEKALTLNGNSVNGSIENRLPHVTNIAFSNVEGEGLLMSVNKTMAVSSGSACTSLSPEPSHVLKAMGLSDDLAHASLRFSLGRFTTEEEIDYTIEEMKTFIQHLTLNLPAGRQAQNTTHDLR